MIKKEKRKMRVCVLMKTNNKNGENKIIKKENMRR